MVEIDVLQLLTRTAAILGVGILGLDPTKIFFKTFLALFPDEECECESESESEEGKCECGWKGKCEPAQLNT